MEIQRNDTIGKLRVIDPRYMTDEWDAMLARVVCECGVTKNVRLSDLKKGRIKSCGKCGNRGGARKHAYKPRRQAPSLTTDLVPGIGKAGNGGA